MEKLKVAIYGDNGHQIWHLLEGYDRAVLVACAAVDMAKADTFEKRAGYPVRRYDTLDEMLRSGRPELVCLCSPLRSEQAKDAIKCLVAGVSVYSEKPSALTEADLDAILAAERLSTAEFHEIADTSFFEPYITVKDAIARGEIGTVVQIYAQKSYPLSPLTRPSDERVDGGLVRQVGIHAARFIEHVCGVKIKDVSCFTSDIDAPFTVAASIAATLDNGGVASIVLNYLNPKDAFGQWGNECLRVFGTDGMVEVTDVGRHTHLYNSRGDLGELELSEKPKHFFEMLVEHLLDGNPMPFDSETELSPLRAVIRMREAANN